MNVSIFISSTFNDMHAERDYIRKKVIPKLIDELAQYQVNIQVTDLRWGVNTLTVDEGEREAKVLHVCVDALQNTKPYFIALLGERYGWVPSIEKIKMVKSSLSSDLQTTLGDLEHTISVTEMEIRLGAIGKDSLLNHSFFCFRNYESYEGMTVIEKQEYIDRLSNNPQQKNNSVLLEHLKDRIRTQCEQAQLNDHIIEYTAKWNPKRHTFEQLNSFGDMLYDRILYDVKRDLLKEKQNFDNEIQERDDIFLSNFIASHKEGFVGRQCDINDIVNFFIDSRKPNAVLTGKTGYFLTGSSGCGKSSLFSMVYSRLIQIAERQSFYILAHAAGVSPESVGVKNMIEKWCRQMSKSLADDTTSTDTDPISQDNYLQVFFKLVSRIQAKGISPIILIDSLDSFEQSDIIKGFQFIPYQVPFFCTSLPGYADKIVLEHPYFMIKNLGAFEESDARLLINSTLKSNFKDLPDIRECLLSKKNENGKPAYESPMWLRMALAILMELGEEDFRAIHKIHAQKEDEKINRYLVQIIQSFPTEVDGLFSLFINLTCRYFNPMLTRKVLTFMAIAQYGIREEVLADLLRRRWDQLEFNSIRYWLRDFVKCNNYDHRWFFTHSILRETIMNQDKEYVKSCQNELFKYLIRKTKEDSDELYEVSYLLINRNEIDYLHANSNKFRSFFPVAFLRALKNNKDKALAFIKNYIDVYYLDVDFVEDILITLSNEDSQYPKLSVFDRIVLDLIDYCISRFETTILLENIDAVDALFQFFSTKSRYLEYYFSPKDYITSFNHLLATFLLLKEHYDKKIYIGSLSFTLFSYWKICIWSYRRLCDYEEKFRGDFLKCISTYIVEWAQWCQQRKCPQDFFKNAYLDFDNIVFFDEKMSFLQQMQYQAQMLLKNSELSGNNFRRTIIEAKGLIDYYVECFQSEEDVQRTTLMDEVNYYPASDNDTESEDHRDSFFGQLCDDLRKTKIKNKYSLNEMSSEEEIENEGVLSSYSNEDDSVDFSIEHTLLYDDKNESAFMNDTSWEGSIEDSISREEEELDSYLDSMSHIYPQYGHKKNSELIKEICVRYKRLALLNKKAGRDEKAKYYIQAIGSLLVECVVNIRDNYCVGDDEITDIIQYGMWLASLGQKDEQIKHAEAVSDALYQSYYHHPQSDSIFRIYDYTMGLYDQQGMVTKKLNLLHRLYEIALRMQIERMFDVYDNCYHDMSYVRPVFLKLFKELKANHMIQDAVVVLERWLDVCQCVYVDEKDTAGFDDINNTYYMLASLYDGTPTLVEGMKERNSIFLQDAYIMVCLKDKWGFIDHKGRVAIPLIYKYAQKAGDGVMSVCKRKWGYVDFEGKEILCFIGDHNFIFDYAIPVQNSWGIVLFNGSWALFSFDGDFVPIEKNCVYFHGITNGLVKVTVQVGNQYNQDFLFVDGKKLLFDGKKNSVKTPNQGIIVATYYSSCGEGEELRASLYNVDGEEVTRHGRYKSICAFGQNELTPAKALDYHAGYINRKGEEIIPFTYKRCRPFSQEGLGAFCTGSIYTSSGAWGFVNKCGEEIIQPQYVDVGDFHEGLAWICQDNGTKAGFGFRGGKFGFINTDGEVVIPARYDDVSSFYKGRALVWQNGKAFFIDKNGEVLNNEAF